MCAILAPLVNSYKRLIPGYEAPAFVSWAHINRSALIRVPATSRLDADATRVEIRCPDPSCNPYLAFAVMLRAGLDGIERELPLADPVEENLTGIAVDAGGRGDAAGQVVLDEHAHRFPDSGELRRRQDTGALARRSDRQV